MSSTCTRLISRAASYAVLLLVVLCSVLIAPPSGAQSSPDPQAAMQQAISAIEQNIAGLEEQIAVLKGQNENETAQQLQQQVDAQKKMLAEMKSQLKSAPRSGASPKAPPASLPAGPAPRVPKKRTALIASLHKSVLSDSEMKTFLLRTQQSVSQRIPAKKRALAENLFKALKSKSAAPPQVAAAACGMWSVGQLAAGLWLMGQAAIESPDPDNLNNYAAFLVMAGAPESALPILWKLDAQYPDNSTVLNNIGQAWFALGDLDEAKKHLDKAVHFFSTHPQANHTEAIIEEARGNKQAAVSFLKNSQEETYSDEREQELESLGSPFDPDRARKRLGMHKDPLGLEKFQFPRWPKNTDQSDEDQPAWDAFHEAISGERRSLEGQIRSLQAKAKQKGKTDSPLGVDVGPRFGPVASDAQNDSSGGEIVLPSPYFKLAVRFQNDALRRYTAFRRQFDAQAPETAKTLNALEIASNKEGGDVNEKYANMPERPGMDLAECGELKAIYGPYLRQANDILEHRAVSYRDAGRTLRNDLSFARQFILDPEEYEIDKLEMKEEFLDDMTAVGGPVFRTAGVCDEGPEVNGETLPDYDDIHCPSSKKFGLNLGYVKWQFTCNQSWIKYDIFFFKGKEATDFRTGVTKGNLDIMLNAEIGEAIKYGPVKAEAKAGIGVSIDYDNGGISDVSLVAVVKAELGPDREFDPTVLPGRHGVSFGEMPSYLEAGVDARIGINSGPSIKLDSTLGEVDLAGGEHEEK